MLLFVVLSTGKVEVNILHMHGIIKIHLQSVVIKVKFLILNSSITLQQTAELSIGLVKTVMYPIQNSQIIMLKKVVLSIGLLLVKQQLIMMEKVQSTLKPQPQVTTVL